MGIAILFVLIGHCIQYGSGANFLNDELYWDNSVMKTVNRIVMWEKVVKYMGDSTSFYVVTIIIMLHFILTLVEMVVMALLCAAVKSLIEQSKIAAKRLIAS